MSARHAAIGAALLWASAATSFVGVPSPDMSLDQPPQADIILIGEVHDNALHHINQADAVEAWAPSAIVFEMITEAQVEAIDGIERTDAAALETALDWQASGWPDFAIYAGIFAAASDLPLYGAARSRDEARRAFSEGAAAVLGEPSLVPPLPAAEQAEREADQLAAHCDALPEEMLPGMVDAQRYRDAAFSLATIKALNETGGPVIVITGNGHVRKDRGMPVYLARLAPEARVVAIGQFEASPGSDAPFDHWIVTDPAEREDPCEAFR